MRDPAWRELSMSTRARLAAWSAQLADDACGRVRLTAGETLAALRALYAARAWADGHGTPGAWRAAALAAHAAARATKTPRAADALRAAGHAASVPHAPDHAAGTVRYAAIALAASPAELTRWLATAPRGSRTLLRAQLAPRR
jgi:hypothetical protein